MSNIAVLIAGGKGTRFGADKPKQFVEINGKPILAYTMDVFQNTKSVDAIAVVCIEEWQDYVKEMRDKYSFSKLKYIIQGGNSRFYSIYNAITFFADKMLDEDCIMIHDAVRPCVTEKIITESFAAAAQYGATLAVAPSFDTMYVSEDGKNVSGIYPREKLFKGQTPETLRYSLALECYKEAEERNLTIDATSELLIELKQPIHLTKGGQENIKITTTDDIIMFKSILKSQHQNLG